MKIRTVLIIALITSTGVDVFLVIDNYYNEQKINFLEESLAFGEHLDASDPDVKCKKWVGIVELSKQDYPHFVEDSILMAERFCGFDVDLLTS